MRARNKQKVRACVRRGKGAKCKHRVEGTKGARRRHNLQVTRERRGKQETRMDTVTSDEGECKVREQRESRSERA